MAYNNPNYLVDVVESD